jgi:hypothetical protein
LDAPDLLLLDQTELSSTEHFLHKTKKGDFYIKAALCRGEEA